VEPKEPTPTTALDGVDVDRIPIYCINLAASTERRARMVSRFAAQGLTDRVQYVPGVEHSSRLVDEYQERTRASTNTDRRRSEVGCLLSHVEALRTFLRETPEATHSAIVFEDDVLLHREWHTRLERVLGNMPANAPVCVLGYLTLGRSDSTWTGINPLKRNLSRMEPGKLWGVQAYWITRAQSRAALENFETVCAEEDPGFVAEFLIWRPNGFVAKPPLAIEDGTPSTIRRASELVRRRAGFTIWGVENYVSVDEDEQLLGLEINRKPKTICLCMIVRNESKVIGRLADSVLDLIDTWVICDTGSTDGTPDRVLDAFKDVPGELFHDEWHDFGTNRTLMLERAQGRADYLLILDADQTLRREGPLPDLIADSYGLLVDEAEAYWVPRLVRSNLPWRYVGAAHEYLTCDQPHRDELLPTLVVEHHGDGGSQSNRLQRNRELLERDLAQDPDNPRTVFYLAQTYRVLGEDELAIRFYARRLQLGGWDEEIFYAMWRHAELVSRSNWDVGVTLLLETWEYRPTRAEPLFSLTEGFRLRNQLRLGAAFGAMGKEIDFPSDILFVHREHYEWAIEYQWSICAFDIGDFEGALEACDHLLTVPTLPPDVRDYVAGSQRRCLAALGRSESEEDLDVVALIRSGTPTLDTLMSGTQVGEIRLSVDPPWPSSNPTIAADEEGFRMLVRTAEDVSSDGTGRVFDEGAATPVLYYEIKMAPDLSPLEISPIVYPPSFFDLAETEIRGLEDCRLIQVGSRWFVLAVSRSFNPVGRNQVVLASVIDGKFEDAKVLEGPDPERGEKDWTPFVVDDEMFIVYSCSPTVVFRLDVDTGQLTKVSRVDASWAVDRERGGSPGVDVGEGTLFVTRRMTRPDGRPLYEHRFLLMDPQAMKFVAASPQFRFLDSRFEFCVGMALADHDLVLSFGVADTQAFLARVPYDEVRASLWPL